MNRRSKLSALAIAVLAALAAPAHAVKPTFSTATAMPACSFSDLTGLSVLACTGFFQGNLLNGGTGATVSSQIATHLGRHGVANAATATYIEKIGSLNVGFTAKPQQLFRQRRDALPMPRSPPQPLQVQGHCAGLARARAICHTLPCQLMANRANRQ